MFRNRFAGSAAALALMSAWATPVLAQQITTGMQGSVRSETGEPIVGASVTVVDSRTDRRITGQTGSNGQFRFVNLATGGPYTVEVTAPGFVSKRVEGLNINLSETTSLRFELEDRGQRIEELIVVAPRQVATQLAIGPSQTFTAQDINALPSIDNDLRDVLRLDPRVIVDEDDADSISCLGVNNRFNNFTIDGVGVNDPFGLNASGFPSQVEQPLPNRAIQEFAVEFAPFDVEYDGFIGCAINAVTKQGSNEFHGDVFLRYTNDTLTADRIPAADGDGTVPFGADADFNDFNWGATIGGPIIKDKLFFFVAYEESRTNEINTVGPVGGGFADTQDFITVEQVGEIASILQTVYGRDPGGIVSILPQDERRILARIDWNINDDHQAAFTYLRQRENEIQPDGQSLQNRFRFEDGFEDAGVENDFWSFRLFSRWTDNFSTELRLSRADFDNIQNPVGGGEAQSANPIPRIAVQVENDGEPGFAVSGPGIFRSANALNTVTDQVRFKADYSFDSGFGFHTLTGGYDLNRLDVFNLFLVNATGTLIFESVDDLINGTLATPDPDDPGSVDDDSSPEVSDIGELPGALGTFSFSGDPSDAAAQFTRSIHSVYLQDELQATPELTVLLGLRYNFYTSGDNPMLNPTFVERYGFENTQGFDGLDILLPRFGFTYRSPYEFFGTTTIQGGAGIFAGGDPTVWFSNAFSNFGGASAQGILQEATGSPPNQEVFFQPPCTAADLQVLDGAGNFTGVPQCIVTQAQDIATANLFDTQATDPDFELPSVVRFNLGVSHFTDFDGAAGGFFDDWNVELGFIYSILRNTAEFVDISQVINPSAGLDGFTIDGRPILDPIDPTVEGCNAVFEGIREGFSNVTPDCFDTIRDDEIILTNATESTRILNFSFLSGKTFNYQTPLINRPGSFDFTLGYTFSDSENRANLTSSQSTSNFDGTPAINRNSLVASTANFEVRHNLSVRATFAQEFFEDLESRLSFVFLARSGSPFSFVFDGGGVFADPSSGTDNILLYVPTGIDDPNADFSGLTQDEIDAFFALIDEFGLDEFAGGAVPRNAFRNRFFTDLDLSFQQELPGILQGHRAIFFVDIENLPNLISGTANTRSSFGSTFQTLDVSINSAGQYAFEPGDFQDAFVPSGGISARYQVQFGFRYEF
ncbi:MAG: carboxypeptidase regulatory-like domain-containing protein [Rhodothalassiaceae bacterium]